MKIFLLGHRGFIGSHLLPALIKRGHQVETNWIYFEQKYDVIINLAAVTHTRNEFDARMIESNIILADKVFGREERIIYASSCSAKHFTNPYAWTKLFMEHRGTMHGNSLGLRFYNVYGPGNNKGIVWYLMRQYHGAKINLRGPDLVRDYVFIDDVLSEIISCLELDRVGVIYKPQVAPGILDVGTGIGTSTMDLVNLFQELSGNKFDITISDPLDTDPAEMVARPAIKNHTSLRDGLLKTIQKK